MMTTPNNGVESLVKLLYSLAAVFPCSVPILGKTKVVMLENLLMGTVFNEDHDDEVPDPVEDKT